MDTSEFPRLIYLVILLAAVVGWGLAESRNSLGKTARSLIVWGLIFLGLMAGYGLWGDIRDDVMPRQTVLEDGGGISVPRAQDGHFHLTLEMNGVPVEFLVDTGASDVVLTREDAVRVGLNPGELAFLGRARTANGVVETAYTSVENVRLGPLSFGRVGVAVNGGEMQGSLLGMSFLSLFDRLEISDNRLILER
ncbi:MAG: TIGR02281 family clan AA aspartic protease [Silicimonas sp.]|nr:TIGR02281 family clan AA aspartic protease [Silicimonas sp.]